jgi:hypothetical protein
VCLGDGAWENAHLSSLTRDERRTALDRYAAVRAEVADIAREATER